MYLFREGRDILINSKTKCSVLLMQIANQKKKKGGGKAEGKTLFVLRRQNASSECNECLCLCAVK